MNKWLSIRLQNMYGNEGTGPLILNLRRDGGEWWSALGPGHLLPGREPPTPIG